MKLHKKLLHLVASFKCAWISLTIGLVLIIFLILFLLKHDSNSQILAFFVGVIASIVATIVLRVSDKYTSSCLAYAKIFFYAEEIILFIDNNIKNNSYSVDECKFNLWQYYMLMCEESARLTYDKDFSLISVAVSNIISSINNKDDVNIILEKREKLINQSKRI